MKSIIHNLASTYTSSSYKSNLNTVKPLLHCTLISLTIINNLIRSQKWKELEAFFTLLLPTTSDPSIFHIYIDYLKSLQKPPSEIVKAYSYVLKRVYEYDSGTLWIEYISYIKTSNLFSPYEEIKRTEYLRGAYISAISTINTHIDLIWKDYLELGDENDMENIYRHNKDMASKIERVWINRNNRSIVPSLEISDDIKRKGMDLIQFGENGYLKDKKNIKALKRAMDFYRIILNCFIYWSEIYIRLEMFSREILSSQLNNDTLAIIENLLHFGSMVCIENESTNPATISYLNFMEDLFNRDGIKTAEGTAEGTSDGTKAAEGTSDGIKTAEGTSDGIKTAEGTSDGTKAADGANTPDETINNPTETSEPTSHTSTQKTIKKPIRGNYLSSMDIIFSTTSRSDTDLNRFLNYYKDKLDPIEYISLLRRLNKLTYSSDGSINQTNKQIYIYDLYKTIHQSPNRTPPNTVFNTSLYILNLTALMSRMGSIGNMSPSAHIDNTTGNISPSNHSSNMLSPCIDIVFNEIYSNFKNLNYIKRSIQTLYLTGHPSDGFMLFEIIVKESEDIIISQIIPIVFYYEKYFYSSSYRYSQLLKRFPNYNCDINIKESNFIQKLNTNIDLNIKDNEHINLLHQYRSYIEEIEYSLIKSFIPNEITDTIISLPMFNELDDIDLPFLIECCLLV
eukprot:GHVP01002185.1.p1 GENE.GHVP01002185.1~~GHVP01002185.1.p1  ORF type:complete len:680 (+),score=67.59 GHVP01002185.1:109-2148(+)